MKLLLSLTGMATIASATTGIMLPIYRYPTGVGKPDWDAVIQAVGAYSKLPFYIVVDNSGGAPYTKNPPDNLIDWATPLGTLNAKDNVRTLGYIATNKSARAIADVKKGIDHVVGDVPVDGIFFDEIDTDPAKLAYNQDIATYARTTLSARNRQTETLIVLNPGVAVNINSASLFDLADAILQVETCYAPRTAAGGALDPDGKPRCPVDPPYTPFTPSSLSVITTERAAWSSVVVHDFYDSRPLYVPASTATLEADVKAILDKKVDSFYITQCGYTANFIEAPASIANVAKLAAQAQGLV